MEKNFKIEIEKIFKIEYSKVLSTLIRILGDFDLAEESLQEAFIIALQKWPISGIPENPCSWLISTGKYKGIDNIRRLTKGEALILEKEINEKQGTDGNYTEEYSWEKHLIDDDQLRLIFYCCHPSLPLDARIALALREVCAMSIEEISKAYLVSYEAIKKRLTRAKIFIKENNIPYEIPSKGDIEQRLDAVLNVIYLIYNEGYSASSGRLHIREDLTKEAIYLAKKLIDLTSISESSGLLALLLLQESRRNARLTETGEIISLEHQDRSLWDQTLIYEGLKLLQQVMMSGKLGIYSIQAAIASVHAISKSIKNTNWELIIYYYDMLISLNPSPVVKLNRAIAIGMHKGPEKALDIINELLQSNKLKTYYPVYSAQAEFYCQMGLKDRALLAYEQALELVQQEPEKDYIKKKINEILKK